MLHSSLSVIRSFQWSFSSCFACLSCSSAPSTTHCQVGLDRNQTNCRILEFAVLVTSFCSLHHSRKCRKESSSPLFSLFSSALLVSQSPQIATLLKFWLINALVFCTGALPRDVLSASLHHPYLTTRAEFLVDFLFSWLPMCAAIFKHPLHLRLHPHMCFPGTPPPSWSSSTTLSATITPYAPSYTTISSPFTSFAIRPISTAGIIPAAAPRSCAPIMLSPCYNHSLPIVSNLSCLSVSYLLHLTVAISIASFRSFIGSRVAMLLQQARQLVQVRTRSHLPRSSIRPSNLLRKSK